ncbi:hypothetical protein F5887DRAFT_964739 [Amanita rubescens]|nr:hypothetical protein F5887DRAFT_964739 [Amanita rubescens]
MLCTARERTCNRHQISRCNLTKSSIPPTHKSTMFSMRKLLLIALIGITSVLAAPAPAGQGESSQVPTLEEPVYSNTGEPLAKSQALLRGNWFWAPNPGNLIIHSIRFLLSFFSPEQFVWYHGAGGSTTLTMPYAEFHSTGNERYWLVNDIKPDYKPNFLGYWHHGEKYIRIIFQSRKKQFLVRELTEKEKEWVKQKQSKA